MFLRVLVYSVLLVLAFNQASFAEEVSKKELAALNESDKLVLQLILAEAMVEGQVGSVVKIDENVRSRYDSMRITYFGSVPAGSLGGGLSLYFGPQALRTSAEFAAPLLKPIQAFLLQIWEGVKWSGRQIGRFLDFIKFGEFMEASSNVMEASYNTSVKPILQLLVTKNTTILSGSAASVGLLYGSYKMATTSAEEAMRHQYFRKMLGQEKEMSEKVDRLVRDVAPIFEIRPSDQLLLSEAILDDLTTQAVNNQFSDDITKYHLDVVGIMSQKGFISVEKAKAVDVVRSLAQATSASKVADTTALETIRENMKLAIALGELIEMQVPKVKETRIREELLMRLGALEVQLNLINELAN